MILLTHICDSCHKAATDEIRLTSGKVEFVNVPNRWKNEICPECLQSIQTETELEREADLKHAC